MGIAESREEIGTPLLEELTNLLTNGDHVALLGPRRGGKAFVLQELHVRASRMPEVDRPHVIVLEADDLYDLNEDVFIARVADQIGISLPAEELRDCPLSGKLESLLLDARHRLGRPLWVFVRDILGFAAPIAREMLYGFKACHDHFAGQNQIGVIVTGSSDFIPMTYEQLSPFRHANKYIVTRLSRRYAKKLVYTIFRRQRGEDIVITDVCEGGVQIDLEPGGFDLLYEQTGGQAHLIHEIMVTSAGISHRPEDNLAGLSRNTEAFVKACIERYVNTDMRRDHYCRMAIREVEREETSFDLLLSVLTDGRSKPLPTQPTTLEISGLINRDDEGRGRLSCPVWHRFLSRFLSKRHIADVYAWQGKWPEAWDSYERLPPHYRHRPVSGDAVFRLRSVLKDWKDSLLDYAPQGPRNVWTQFKKGIQHLLGFDSCYLCTWSRGGISSVFPGDVYPSQEDVFIPAPHVEASYADMLKWPESIYSQTITEVKYWLDPDRMRLFCDPQAKVKMPRDIHPVLLLSRTGVGNHIDSRIQKLLLPVVDRFWNAFIAACDIEYRTSIGDLRERHLNTINHVNALFLQEPDMGKVMQGMAEAIVQVGGYYRAQICLVDPVRECIQAVACSCRDPDKNINFDTNYPLSIPSKLIEDWDSQPWVVHQKRRCVIPDVTDPNQRNPRARPKECGVIGMKAVAIVPMMIGPDVIGTMHVECANKEAPSDAEVEMCELLASQLATILYQAQRLTLLQQAICSLPDQVRIIDPARRIMFLNVAAAENEERDISAGWQEPRPDCICGRHAQKDRAFAASNCLVNELKPPQSRTMTHHYVIARADDGTVHASDWRMAPIDDFRARLGMPFDKANGRIGFVERVHDLTPLYELIECVQNWLRADRLPETARQVVEYLSRNGYGWARIYVTAQAGDGREYLMSVEQFGLQESEHIRKFIQGGIKYYREDAIHSQPWHVLLTAKQPAIYECRSNIDGGGVCPAPEFMGMPRFWTAEVLDRAELEKTDIRWIEAPLLMGEQPVGKITLGMPQDMSPEKWQLLTISVAGIAVAINNPIQRAERDKVIDETWKIAAARTVHELTNNINSVDSNAVYAKSYLTSNPEKAKEKLECVENAMKVVRETLTAYQLFAFQRPFRDTRILTVEELLTAVRTNSALPLVPKMINGNPDAIVRASPTCFVDVVKLLMENSIKHSGKAQAELKVEIRATCAGANKDIGLGDDYVCIEYVDNGKGIPGDQKKEVFVPFTSYHQQGTGLGLAIAEKYVRWLNGYISENGTPGQGVRFVMHLPVHRKEH